MTEKTLDEASEKNATTLQQETEEASGKEHNKTAKKFAEKQHTSEAKTKPISEEDKVQLQEITEYLKIALEKVQEENKEVKEQLLRYHADAQNTKRRAEQDVAKAHKYALVKFTESLLPVIDSLENGLVEESSDEKVQAMKKGMELTLKLFLDTLKKFNIEQISSENSEPFNPDYHQAISQIDNPDMEPGLIINVFQKGYTLNGRLIRPAMVVVSK